MNRERLIKSLSELKDKQTNEFGSGYEQGDERWHKQFKHINEKLDLLIGELLKEDE